MLTYSTDCGVTTTVSETVSNVAGIVTISVEAS